MEDEIDYGRDRMVMETGTTIMVITARTRALSIS
jgi:hypothetical protein